MINHICQRPPEASWSQPTRSCSKTPAPSWSSRTSTWTPAAHSSFFSRQTNQTVSLASSHRPRRSIQRHRRHVTWSFPTIWPLSWSMAWPVCWSTWEITSWTVLSVGRLSSTTTSGIRFRLDVSGSGRRMPSRDRLPRLSRSAVMSSFLVLRSKRSRSCLLACSQPVMSLVIWSNICRAICIIHRRPSSWVVWVILRYVAFLSWSWFTETLPKFFLIFICHQTFLVFFCISCI